MYINRSIASLGLSVIINLAILYGISSSRYLWKLDNSTLNIGADVQSLLENMTITSKAAVKNLKTKHLNEVKKQKTNTVTRTMEKKPAINKQLDIPKSDNHKLSKNFDKEKNDQPDTDISSTNSNAAQARPEIMQKARLMHTPPPIGYPAAAIKENAYGKVTLSALISDAGKISQIKILNSSGYKILDDAAIEWFEKLEFSPANNGKIAVSSTVTQVITFSLKDAKHEA